MKIIDLENSFLDFIIKNVSWRTNIKSVLECKKNKKTYYLAKETRAQYWVKNPFQHSSRFEFLGLVDSLGTANFFRTSAVDGNKETLQLGAKILNSVSEAFLPYFSEKGLIFPSSTWLVSANKKA